MTEIPVGAIGFASISGRVGASITAAQTAADIANLLRGKRAENAGWPTHAFIVGQDGYFEAMPSGFRYVPKDESDRMRPGYAYAWIVNTDLSIVEDRARRMLGTPYSFADYAALVGLHAGLPRGLLGGWVNRRKSNGLPVRAICSQACDEIYRQAGINLFDDGRLPQDVLPGALFWRMAHLGSVHVF